MDVIIFQRLVCTHSIEFYDVFQPFNSGGIYDIDYETGTSLAVQVLAFDNVNLKTWSRYLERLDEEFIERSGTWYVPPLLLVYDCLFKYTRK